MLLRRRRSFCRRVFRNLSGSSSRAIPCLINGSSGTRSKGPWCCSPNMCRRKFPDFYFFCIPYLTPRISRIIRCIDYIKKSGQVQLWSAARSAHKKVIQFVLLGLRHLSAMCEMTNLTQNPIISSRSSLKLPILKNLFMLDNRYYR